MEQWKSYKDVAKWLEENFKYDVTRLNEAEYRSLAKDTPLPIKTPEETFKSKYGICQDSVLLTIEALNKIDPSYKPEVIYLRCRPEYRYDHYVCKFEIDSEMYVMDYGNSQSNLHMNGIHGPYKSLEEYKQYYEKNNYLGKKVNLIQYGWPPHRQKELEKKS